MRKVKLVKMSEELHKYIREIGDRRYGKNLSTPYIIYLAFREIANKKR